VTNSAAGVSAAVMGSRMILAYCFWSRSACRELEKRFRTHFRSINKFLSGEAEQISMKEAKEVIGQLDRVKKIELVKRRLHRLQ